jgi:ribosome biogenesis GTPase A
MANVGVNPSVTKAMQEMHLDMCVKLLDYFGIIFVSSKNNEMFATF